MIAYNMGVDDGHNGAISLQINELSLTPIELPSEKEIAEEIVNIVDTPEYGKLVYAGALWVIEQIKQQENGK